MKGVHGQDDDADHVSAGTQFELQTEGVVLNVDRTINPGLVKVFHRTWYVEVQ